MNFKFTEDEQKTIDMIHEFGVNVAGPGAAEIDAQERFPSENVEKLRGMGMMGICYPKKYGGAEHSYLAYIAVVEELAKHCATTAVMLSDHHSLGSWPLIEFGTEEQKQKFLVPLCKGQKLGAFGVTEPSAGSDLGNQKMTAVDAGDHWVLNGQKVFITNGYYADTYYISAVTDPDKGSRGISGFIVEKGTPGFTFGAKEKKMGIRGSATYELIFQDCKIPKENLLYRKRWYLANVKLDMFISILYVNIANLKSVPIEIFAEILNVFMIVRNIRQNSDVFYIGERGKGFKIALATLDGGRIGVGAQALGIAQSAIDHCKEYVTTHCLHEQRISQYQYVQFELADMQARVDAARLLIYRAAQAKQDHDPYSHLAAMGKLYASEAATIVTRRCMQLVGDDGYTNRFPFERLMRDSKITEIYEGTSEVQRMVISSWMGIK